MGDNVYVSESIVVRDCEKREKERVSELESGRERQGVEVTYSIICQRLYILSPIRLENLT